MTSTLTWHKWPEEKPTECCGESLVMIVAVMDHETGRRYTTHDFTTEGHWFQFERASLPATCTVTAWAAFPPFPNLDKEGEQL